MVCYSEHIQRLISDIVSRVPIFSHINVDQIMVSVSYARNSSMDGVWAELYPMKYQNGHYSIRERKGNVIYLYKTDRLHIGQREILYILYLMMPRFQNLSFNQKLKTLFHELYHISPGFDGKLRQIHSRFIYHGSRNDLFERNISWWVNDYMNRGILLKEADILKYSWSGLKRKYPHLQMDYIPEPEEKVKKIVYRRKPKRGRAL